LSAIELDELPSNRISTSFFAFSADVAPSIFTPAGRAGGVEAFTTPSRRRRAD